MANGRGPVGHGTSPWVGAKTPQSHPQRAAIFWINYSVSNSLLNLMELTAFMVPLPLPVGMAVFELQRYLQPENWMEQSSGEPGAHGFFSLAPG